MFAISNQMVMLETSIQIDRLIGDSSQQTAIESHLAASAGQFVSSHYVFMEFQRSVLSDYVRVYHAILRHTSWNDTAHALRSGVLAYRPRSLGRCLQILTYAMERSHLQRENALELLQVLILYELPARFWRHCQPIADAITCDLVVAGVKFQVNQRFSIADVCRKESAACHLPDFLADHRMELTTIANHLKAHPRVLKAQEKLERLLGNVINDPRVALGQSTCWPLGDVIIALQSLSCGTIWTIDGDFQPIAEALGLTLYHPILRQ